jgi:hypothetical protein
MVGSRKPLSAMDIAVNRGNHFEAELTALRKGLQDEVDLLGREMKTLSAAGQKYRPDTSRRKQFRAKHEAVGSVRDRLSALLDSSGGEK